MDTQSEQVQEQTVHSFSVYGTLRDDDDSGATWTAPFLLDLPPNSAFDGIVKGFRMVRNQVHNYPYALKTDNDEDLLVVRVLTFPAEIFSRKLAEADVIEMYVDQISICRYDCWYVL